VHVSHAIWFAIKPKQTKRNVTVLCPVAYSIGPSNTPPLLSGAKNAERNCSLPDPHRKSQPEHSPYLTYDDSIFTYIFSIYSTMKNAEKPLARGSRPSFFFFLTHSAKCLPRTRRPAPRHTLLRGAAGEG
jgi:hypothetical protein